MLYFLFHDPTLNLPWVTMFIDTGLTHARTRVHTHTHTHTHTHKFADN